MTPMVKWGILLTGSVCLGLVLGALELASKPCDCQDSGEKLEQARTELAARPIPARVDDDGAVSHANGSA